MSEYKYLGNCQCCGRLQAVTRGHSAKHGYTVQNGWFQGVCSGHNYPSMQTHRDTTDAMVAQVLADVESYKKDLEGLKTGKFHPVRVEVGSRRYLGNGEYSDNTVPYAEAPEYAQKEGVRREIYRIESRIRAGESFAANMTGLADRVHGTPLIEEKKPEVAARILPGEQRVAESGVVFTSRGQEGARVYYTFTRNGQVYKPWMGSRAWRNLKLVEAV